MIQAGKATDVVVRCGLFESITCDVVVAVVFFYDRELDEGRLAHGLTRTLGHIPPYGGRLRERGSVLEIHCSDSGVPMNTGDSDMTLEQAIASVNRRDSDLVEHIDVARARQGIDPLLRIRITRLAGGATAVGCSMHHVVGDMHSFMLFMRSWSAFVEGATPPEATIVENREDYLDAVLPPHDTQRSSYRLLEPDEVAGTFAELGRAMQTNEVVQLRFDDAEVQGMREEFGAGAGRTLSKHDALCGHLLHSLCLLESGPSTRFLNFAVNLRSRLAIPSSVVGNMITIVEVPGDERPEVVAAGVRDAVDNLERSHLNWRTDREFLLRCEKSQLALLMFRALDPVHPALLVSDWSGFGLYDVTFDGRPPVLCCPAPGPTCFALPWIAVLSDGLGGSGHVCTLSVPAEIADLLLRTEGDAVLHRFRQVPSRTESPLRAGPRPQPSSTRSATGSSAAWTTPPANQAASSPPR